MDRVRGVEESPPKPRVHLPARVPDALGEPVTVLDAATAVDALKNKAYGFAGDFGPCTDGCRVRPCVRRLWVVDLPFRLVAKRLFIATREHGPCCPLHSAITSAWTAGFESVSAERSSTSRWVCGGRAIPDTS